MGEAVGVDSRFFTFSLSIRFRCRRYYRRRDADAVVEVLARLLGGQDGIIRHGSLCRLGDITIDPLVQLGTSPDADDGQRTGDEIRNADHQHEIITA